MIIAIFHVIGYLVRHKLLTAHKAFPVTGTALFLPCLHQLIHAGYAHLCLKRIAFPPAENAWLAAYALVEPFISVVFLICFDTLGAADRARVTVYKNLPATHAFMLDVFGAKFLFPLFPSLFPYVLSVKCYRTCMGTIDLVTYLRLEFITAYRAYGLFDLLRFTASAMSFLQALRAVFTCDISCPKLPAAHLAFYGYQRLHSNHLTSVHPTDNCVTAEPFLPHIPRIRHGV